MMTLDKTKKVLVAGAGISGKNTAAMLAKKGYSVILYDGNDKLDQAALQQSIGEQAEVLLGELPDEVIASLTACVISPGIPLDVPFVEKLKKAGVPIVGEVELAYRFAKGRLAAITGTNGKTTTTALVGHICEGYFPSVFVVGNIGNAYTKEALNTTDESVTVAEMSSFQLETIDTFHPQVSAILNITPDHLNRHKTMECYGKIKSHICMNQTEDEICVLNYEDPFLSSMNIETKAKKIYFSSKRVLEEGAYLEDGWIVTALNGEKTRICSTDELNIIGRHNHENAMAAVLMTKALGVPDEVIRERLRSFKAVEHRIEYVCEKNGVIYYNDSKGTNPDAAIQAIRAMTRPTVLLAGGYDKNADFKEWLQSFEGKVKLMIVMGATAGQIAEEAEKLHAAPVVFADTFEEAVEKAEEAAEAGDAVLLSPACASWGMFPNYEVRGKVFKKLVRGTECE